MALLRSLAVSRSLALLHSLAVSCSLALLDVALPCNPLLSGSLGPVLHDVALSHLTLRDVTLSCLTLRDVALSRLTLCDVALSHCLAVPVGRCQALLDVAVCSGLDLIDVLYLV